MYVFDSTPMWIALVLYVVFHPGRLMPGKESDFPSRAERKELGRMMKTGQLSKENHGLLPVQEPAPAYEPVHSSYGISPSPEPTAQVATSSSDTRYYGRAMEA